MISDEQLRIWAAEAKEAYQSALDEYCPEEFWLLLNEVARLKAELAVLAIAYKHEVAACQKAVSASPKNHPDLLVSEKTEVFK